MCKVVHYSVTKTDSTSFFKTLALFNYYNLHLDQLMYTIMFAQITNENRNALVFNGQSC